MLLSCVAIAQQNPLSGRLYIFSDTAESFFVYLNGELQNNEPKTDLTIANLNQRYYNVKIIFKNKFLKDITKNYVAVTGKDGLTFEEAVYKIKIDYKNKKTKLNYYSGRKILPEYYPNEEILDEQNPSNSNTIINNGINTTINNGKRTEAMTREHLKFKQRKYSEITNVDFEIAKTAITKENFEDQKLAIAQNILSNYCLTTNQISQIVLLFSFADNQLKFAKQAYDSCIDFKNYYLLKDIFTFKIDQQEFMNFINSKK